MAQRLRAVISAKKHGISKVADVFDITNATLISWIKKCKYNDDISVKAKKSKTPKLNEKQIKQIESWLTKEYIKYKKVDILIPGYIVQ